MAGQWRKILVTLMGFEPLGLNFDGIGYASNLAKIGKVEAIWPSDLVPFPPFPPAMSKHPEVQLLSLILSLSLCLFNVTKEDLSRRLEMKGKQKGFF